MQMQISPLSPLRQKVLDEAESWLGTPFRHSQRCKGAGVDCGQFLIGVFYEVGLIPCVKPPYYTRDFHLHRSEEWYKTLVEAWSRPVEEKEVLPADVVLYRVGRVFSHGAIVIQWPMIIHSYVTDGVMHVDGTQGHFMGRHKVFYRHLMFEEGDKR